MLKKVKEAQKDNEKIRKIRARIANGQDVQDWLVDSDGRF